VVIAGGRTMSHVIHISTIDCVIVTC